MLLGHCLQGRRARLWPWWRLCEGSCRAETFSGPGWGKGCVAVRVWQRHKIKTQGILETWRRVAEPLADKEPADNVKHIEPSSGIRAHFLAQLSIQLCQVEKLSCGHMPANLPCRTNGKQDSVFIRLLSRHLGEFFFSLNRGIPVWSCTWC